MPRGIEVRGGQPLEGPEALRPVEWPAPGVPASDRLLRALLDDAPMGVVACDLHGRITRVNRAADRMWGGAGARGCVAWDEYRAFHSDGSSYVAADWPPARSLREGVVVPPIEMEIERFDGGRAAVLCGAAPIVGPGGDVEGAVVLFAEVTASRARERDLLERERNVATRLGRLQALTAALSEAVTPEEVARAALEHAQGALGVRTGGLWACAEEGTLALVESVGFSAAQRDRYARIPADARYPVAQVVRAGEPLWIRSRAELRERFPDLRTSAVGDPISVACLPMQVKGRCPGALSFAFSHERELSAEDRSFLLVLTRHCAQALERARLFDAEHRARGEAVAANARNAFLYEATTLLASSLDYEETLARVAQLAVPRVADWCVVDLAEDIARGRSAVVVAHADPAKVELVREMGRRHPPDPAAQRGAPAVVRTGRSELYLDIHDEDISANVREPEQLRLARELGLCSGMVVPMTTRGKTLGAMTFLSTDSRRRFGPADVEMAEHLGRRAALAIDNARLFEQAQEAVRAREEVVAIVSHDLKNPLNAILMSAGLLRKSVGDPPRALHHVDAIERAVRRMRSLVRDLLDLARMEGGRFTLERHPCLLESIAAEALALFTSLAAEKDVALEAHLEPVAGARVLCDRERLLQVFSNLLGNAVAFTPGGGRVAVEARRAGGEVTIAVADTGPGIPADEQRHVFERFWKSRASGMGTGLGLSIAKGIVNAHGGRIWVESRPGEGARFLFTLPDAP
jgi:signal transduction histidine kinase